MQRSAGMVLVGSFVCLAALLIPHKASAQTVTKPVALMAVNADGKNWRKFFQVPQVGTHGSPSISRDGKFLAFDGWFAQSGESSNDARLFIISTDRDEFWMLGSGSMPSWGADSKRLVASVPGSGVCIITIANQAVETIDQSGWGGQWSPDGRLIAYNKGTQIWLHNTETRQAKLHADLSGEYSSLMWNGTWSPDSRRFVFAARTENDDRHILSVAIDTPTPAPRKHVTTGKPNTKFAWHPHQPRVVFPMHSAERKHSQLWEFNPTNADAPRLVAGQDPTLDVFDPCWSTDGETLYCVVR